MNYSLAVLLLVIVHTAYSAKFHRWDDTDTATLRAFRRGVFRDQIDKRTGGIGYCYANGDPHYVTFDGRRYDFMGACRYIHVTDYCRHNDHRGINFKVVSENYNCGSRVSCINAVDVSIGSETVYLKKYKTNIERPEYSVRKEGSNVVVRTKPAGLTVLWNMGHRLEIQLDQRFKDKVCGMCGNFDGQVNSQYTMSNGQKTSDVNKFGQSWKSGGKCGKPVAPQHPCEKKPHRKAVAMKDCAVIKSDHFKACRVRGVDLDVLYNNCVYDVCAETINTMKDSSCEAIKEASLECSRKNWWQSRWVGTSCS